MKNLVLIFSVIFLVMSCTTIDEQYTGEGIKVKPEKHKEYYDDSPYYSHYMPSYYSPIFWGGFSLGFPYFFWSPYSYYGFYDYYYGYYGGYYRGYPIFYRSRYGRTVITKKQLKKRTSSRVTTGNVHRTVGKTTSTGKIKSTVKRSSSSTRSRGTSSGRVSRGTVSRGTVKKKK
ncbi:MAG: hypothetical protein GTN73_06560 [Candidatus Aminicenantes bacterium]|nr:hypothetical protein [Candidatus Aminicenantes bacterium]